MFQNYGAPSAPVRGDSRLQKLRALMQQLNVTMIVVPHNDEQNNEYLPIDKERLAWLSGFTGSAGASIVTHNDAVLFVDGRYTLQAAEQSDPQHWTVGSLIDTPPHTWFAANADKSDVLAYDPWLHTANQIKLFEAAAAQCGANLHVLDANPIDPIWEDQPGTPCKPVKIHDFDYAGKLSSDKLEEMEAALALQSADVCVLTDPASVCWLFNIRGGDVAHTPITLAHAILRRDEEPLLFIDDRKLDTETTAFLTQVCKIKPPSDLENQLSLLSKNARVMLDNTSAPIAINTIVTASGGDIVNQKDPVSLPRACKNEVELEGARAAHKRDGAAMATFLAWLDNQKPGSVDEITASRKLETIRTDMATNMPLRDVSFDTISGSGPNGAIVHYRVDESTNRKLGEGELYLCDSGGQYDDGTTDITRTVAIGAPGKDERRAFTLVLKGHIAIALARFPKGTRGVDIDVLARISLWQHGMDYAHGTGHGVGSYLAVHEGPQNISKRGMQAFLPGMIVSNEPGYYRTGKFGIRIENLVIVRDDLEIVGGDQPMLGFETITLAPIDTRLVDPSLMNDEEIDWINAYHARVRQELSSLVSENVRLWLIQATEPIKREPLTDPN